MNKKASTDMENFVWHLYEFTFNDTNATDDELFEAVHEKLSDLDLKEAPTDIKYEKVAGDTTKMNVWVKTLLNVPEQVVFRNEPVRAMLSEETQPDPGESEVQTVTFKGAVRNPPPTSDPLP